MLTVHRLLDAIAGRGGDRMTCDAEDPYRVVPTLRAELPTAEKFDFGQLPLEAGALAGEWVVPKLTPDELEMWSHGLIPLPAPRCWFEFTLGGTRTGFYVRETGGRWVVMRADRLRMFPEPPGTPLTRTLPHPLWCLDCMVYTFDQAVGYDPLIEDVSATIDAPASMVRVQREKPEEFRATVRTAYLVLYLALMINSRSTERRRADAPRQTYTDARRGLAKESVHTVVDIVPKAYQGGHGSGGGGPRRLHWVRSHTRRFDHRTDGSKWCPMLAGPNGETGCWAVVIPRHVKGRAELGSVDHEYRVNQNPEAA